MAIDLTAADGVILDMDGTLIDSVYERALAWKEAFAACGAFPPAWTLHRLVGRDGRGAVREVAAALGRSWSDDEALCIRRRYAEAYRRRMPGVRPLPGAVALLEALERHGLRWAIATTASLAAAREALGILGASGAAVVVAGDQVTNGKPDPEILEAAAGRLRVPLTRAVVVGDSAWDAMAASRCGAAAIGVLSGGWSREELLAAGAQAVVDGVHDLAVGRRPAGRGERG
ncbi:MAG TPA: HAD family hydrolase [Candidatus Eisenbacteria bacterium]|nr:HAD family hydrolase [Candidatus Eisenbacteria bacterium]